MTDRSYGVVMVLAERFRTQRYPHLADIQRRVDHGERLSDRDLQFMTQSCREIRGLLHRFRDYPDCRELAALTADMVTEISAEALALEAIH